MNDNTQPMCVGKRNVRFVVGRFILNLSCLGREAFLTGNEMKC